MRKGLQSPKDYRQARQHDGKAGNGMGKSIEFVQGQEINSFVKEKYNGTHGGNGNDRKGYGYHDKLRPVLLRRRIHEQRNKRFAWAKDKNQK